MAPIEEKKVLEYEDAPSGYALLYRVKEPFMKYEGGFGFKGVLVFDGKTDQVQCHLCGTWHEALGYHLRREHAMTASAYKEKTGLRQTTALIGEKFRAKLIANGLEARKANLRSPRSHSSRTREKIRATLKKRTMENMNERGTCPDQLAARLKALHDKLGRTPSTSEITFYDTILAVYGKNGLKACCERAGIPFRKSGENINHPTWKWNHESAVKFYREFWIKNGRLPKVKTEMPRALLNALTFCDGKKPKINRTDVVFQATNGEVAIKVQQKNKRYSEEMLINALLEFKLNHGREASTSDCRRKLLPAAASYRYHFGSWTAAKEFAYNLK